MEIFNEFLKYSDSKIIKSAIDIGWVIAAGRQKARQTLDIIKTKARI